MPLYLKIAVGLGLFIAMMVLGLFIAVSRGNALEYFVEGGIGMSQFQRTVPDGTWVQEGFPHQFHWQDYAYRAGVGVNLTSQWSLGVNYVDLGTVQSDTFAVSDFNYDPLSHRCVDKCDEAMKLNVYDSLKGGEVIGTYKPWNWTVSPFIRVGIAGFQHSLHYDALEHDGRSFQDDLRGIVIAGVAGLGACYHNWLCADMSYYKGFTTTQFPISTGVIVPMLSFKWEF